MRAPLFCLLCLVTGSSFAAPVVWTLNDIVFEHCNWYSSGCSYSASASGTFTYDASTNTYSSISITTDPGDTGPGLPGITYTGSNENYDLSGFEQEALFNQGASGFALAASFFDEYICPEGPCQNVLYLFFDSPLTNSGGIISFDSSVSREKINVATAGPGVFSRYIVSGTVSAVPVPAAVWLFGPALAGLGFLRRKQSV